MRTEPDHISGTLSPWGILGTIFSPFVILIGLIGASPFLHILLCPFDRTFWQLLIALPFAVGYLALAAAGAAWLLRSLLVVHMRPEGIEITLFGKTFRSYPADRLQTFCLLQRGLSKSQTTHLVISTLSIEEMAVPRMRNPENRPKVPRRSAPQTREEAFAEEYLRKGIKSIPWHIPKKDLFWLNFSLENMALLRLLYPHVRWLIAPESQSTPTIYSRDSDPAAVVFPGEKQIIVFHRDRISAMKGDAEKTLMEAPDIRSIIRVDDLDGGGSYWRTVLVLSRYSTQELVQFREKLIAAPRLALLRRLPCWHQLAVRNGVRLPDPALGHWNRHGVVIPWFPRREQTLRDLYPEAELLDCTNKTIFDLIYQCEVKL